MKKIWENPRFLGLELHHTNDGEGVYYTTNARATLVCRGIGYRDTDGKIVITEPCGQSIWGATLSEANANWLQHCVDVHTGKPAIGEELSYGRVS